MVQLFLHPTEAKMTGSNHNLVGANGHINASSKEELIKAFQTIANMVEAGTLSMQTAEEKAELKAARIAALQEATANEAKWAELGADLTKALYTTANREGFMRKLFAKVEVENQNIVRIPVKYKSTTSYVTSGSGQIAPQNVRDKYMPPEFFISANLWIDERELAQGSSDQLEDKFYEAQEHIQVREDQYWRGLCDHVVGLANDLQILGGGLDPDSLALMKEQVTRWHLAASHFLFANDGLNDLTGTVFGGWLDPVSQYEIVMSGTLGQILGMSLTTDAYREPQLKVFDRGEMYIVTSPEFHGAYTERGPIQSRSKESDGSGQGPARGWYVWELVSISLHNNRSVVKGVKN